VHACLDVARRRQRRSVEVELTPIVMPSVGDETAGVADRELIDDALRQLDPEFRAVVVLHYFLGMPLQDVAVSMRIPIGTVKSRLNRSLRTMRIALSEAEIDEPAAVPEGQFA
jgi:RNA polymerase sigma-70 factor (ECF subfamily)